jgi:hypothetical protein
MFAKMIVAGALITACGLALASDASYDQEQIRSRKVTLVEGALGAPKQNPVNGEAAPAIARDCGCQAHHA